MGPWYRRVNALVASANGCETLRQLIDVLGEPDKIEAAGETVTPSRFFESIGSIFRFGDEHADIILTYIDPYRPRHRYKYGVENSRIVSTWRETVSESNKYKI